MIEFCGHFMVFMWSFCVFLARNLFADVVSHYLSMKIYQHSTKTWYKNRDYNLKEVYKLHPENLKKNTSLYNLTIIMIMRSTEKLKNPPLKSPLLKSLPLKSPPLKSPSLRSPPLKYSMLKYLLLKRPQLNCQ